VIGRVLCWNRTVLAQATDETGRGGNIFGPEDSMTWHMHWLTRKPAQKADSLTTQIESQQRLIGALAAFFSLRLLWF